jgi:hypothetical protein
MEDAVQQEIADQPGWLHSLEVVGEREVLGVTNRFMLRRPERRQG